MLTRSQKLRQEMGEGWKERARREERDWGGRSTSRTYARAKQSGDNDSSSYWPTAAILLT